MNNIREPYYAAIFRDRNDNYFIPHGFANIKEKQVKQWLKEFDLPRRFIFVEVKRFTDPILFTELKCPDTGRILYCFAGPLFEAAQTKGQEVHRA